METLRATRPIRIDGVVLIPVQRVRIEPWQGRHGVVIHALAEPRAIVLDEGGRWRALGLDGAELALEPLLEEVPGLAAVVERERRRDA